MLRLNVLIGLRCEDFGVVGNESLLYPLRAAGFDPKIEEAFFSCVCKLACFLDGWRGAALAVARRWLLLRLESHHSTCDQENGKPNFDADR